MSCRDAAKETGSRCAKFAELGECVCEQVQSTDYSPGPVSNEEILIRHIFSPAHFDAGTGTLKPQAFSDVWGIGLSVTRGAHVLPEDFRSLTLQLLGVKKKRNPRNALVGVLLISVDTVRGMHFDAALGRMLCVYDTGTKSNPAHADVCTPLMEPTSDEKAALRDCLTSMFGELYIDLDAVFN